MARGCGLSDYEGAKLPVTFKLDFGKKIIHECPISYCDFTYLGDAVECWKYYEDNYLPEVYDPITNRPLGILDQSEFFVDAHMLVNMAKNKAQEKLRKEQDAQSK